MYSKTDLVLGGAVMAAAAGVAWLGWRFAFFVAPFAWTGEPARLATLLAVRPGMRVAEIGAGTGALALEMTRAVGPSGEVVATELSAQRVEVISRKVSPGGGGRLRVVRATDSATGLDEGCCDALYMRAVLHHIGNPRLFAEAAQRAVVAGGRVAVIDFPPGGLPFHGADHGITEERVIDAFARAGLQLRTRIGNWGGGMFLLLFQKSQVTGHQSQVVQ